MSIPPWYVTQAVGLAMADVPLDEAVHQLLELDPGLTLRGEEEQLVRSLPTSRSIQERALLVLEMASERAAVVRELGLGAAPQRERQGAVAAASRPGGSEPDGAGEERGSSAPGPTTTAGSGGGAPPDPADELAALGDIGAAIDRVWRRVYEVADVGELPPELALAVSDAFSDELRSTLPKVLDQLTGDWVSFAKHELRQPLAVVATTIDTLLERGWGLDEESRHALLRRAGRQALVMQRILDQLVRAKSIETGEFEVDPEEIDVRELVETVVADFDPQTEGIEVVVRAPHGNVTACVETFAAAEILVVLLRNAFDHAPCDEPVVVEVLPVPGMALIAVHDDGPGVPPKDRERIFERGGRLDRGGELGLGLFIARGLARAHGGSLTVGDSPRLGGARFELLLPAECS